MRRLLQVLARFALWTAATAVASAGAYVLLCFVVGGEAWDATAYGPILLVGTAITVFLRPDRILGVGLGVILGQLAGWAAYSWITDAGSLGYWPLVTFLTLPFVVAPAVALGAIIGAVAGWWRMRRIA